MDDDAADKSIPAIPNSCAHDSKEPYSVTFFPNGMAAVGNYSGEQIGHLQGKHKDTIKALLANGTPWQTLPDIVGVPFTEKNKHHWDY